MESKAREILEAAKWHLEKSIYWFDQAQDDEECWQWYESRSHDDKARGLLEAYHILTGETVNANIISIRSELACL